MSLAELSLKGEFKEKIKLLCTELKKHGNATNSMLKKEMVDNLCAVVHWNLPFLKWFSEIDHPNTGTFVSMNMSNELLGTHHIFSSTLGFFEPTPYQLKELENMCEVVRDARHGKLDFSKSSKSIAFQITIEFIFAHYKMMNSQIQPIDVLFTLPKAKDVQMTDARRIANIQIESLLLKSMEIRQKSSVKTHCSPDIGELQIEQSLNAGKCVALHDIILENTHDNKELVLSLHETLLKINQL